MGLIGLSRLIGFIGLLGLSAFIGLDGFIGFSRARSPFALAMDRHINS